MDQKMPIRPKTTKKGHHSVWKLREKILFNIASEASYVYIRRGQMFHKIAIAEQVPIPICPP